MWSGNPYSSFILTYFYFQISSPCCFIMLLKNIKWKKNSTVELSLDDFKQKDTDRDTFSQEQVPTSMTKWQQNIPVGTTYLG